MATPKKPASSPRKKAPVGAKKPVTAKKTVKKQAPAAVKPATAAKKTTAKSTTAARKSTTAANQTVAKPAATAKPPETVAPVVSVAKPAEPVKPHEAAKESPPQKAPVFPLLAGGLVAGAIGFGAASLFFDGKPAGNTGAFSQIEAALEQQQQEMRVAEAKIEALLANQGTDADTAHALADLAAQSEQSNAGLAVAVNAVSQNLVAVEDRLLILEKRPIAEAGGMTSEAVAAFERDMAAMRDMLATQRAEVAKISADMAAGIEMAVQQAAILEDSAEAKTSEATLRAAMSQLQIALDRGGAYEASLADLAAAGVDIPPILVKSAITGVPTLSSLQKSFPDAARAALAAANKAGSDADTMGKLGAFLRGQVGARSLEPREGNDPDAVLSRTEAALKKGELDVALALTGALPPEARAAMSDWIAAVRSRDGAVLALRRLNQDLSDH